MKIESFNLTEKQIEACKEVKKTIQNAHKLGVRILAKSDILEGYSQKPFDLGLVAELHRTADVDYDNPVPCLAICKIDGSGADDTEHFKLGVIE